MGGIKNKLSKLSNKVKNLLTNNKSLPDEKSIISLPHRGEGRWRSHRVRGISKAKAFGFCHLIRQTPSATFPVKGKELGSPWVRGAVSRRLAEGSLSAGLNLTTLTKYLGIACLSLAILSVLTLNIISTYSSNNLVSNAQPVDDSSVTTSANAELDPTSISISISSYSSSSSTGSNDPNLSLSIPQGGGIATGRHTVEVSTGSSVIGYELQLSSNDNETALVNNDASGISDSGSKSVIPTTTGTIDNPSILADRTYGYTLTDLSSGGAYGGNDDVSNTYSDNPAVNTAIWSGLQPSTSPATIATVDDTDNILTIGQANETTHDIYYGVNVQNPAEIRAGNYSRGVVYTAIGELMPQPEVTDLVLNSSYIPYYTGINDYPAPDDTAYGTTSILTGQNLSTITAAWVDMNDNEAMDSGEEVTNLTHATGNEANTKLTFEAPQAPRQSISDQFPEGSHDVYLEWSGGDPIKIENGWNYIRQSECVTTTSPIDSRQSDCIVDIDDNMIPVYYSDDEDNPEWLIVPDCTDVDGKRTCDNSSIAGTYESVDWYDYSAGKWANAVTLRDDFEKGCYTVYQEKVDYLEITRIDDKATCNSTDSALTPLRAMQEISKGIGLIGYLNGGGFMIGYNGKWQSSMPLHPDDILGYWVYIPRYSYEVMRRDAIDLVQQPEDFKIKFETTDTTKKVPVEGCSDTNNPKSYRVGCGLNRTYTNTATDITTNEVTNTTWATHPAFTWMDENGNPVELNGIWVGKFETTGSTEEPTVLPNEKHLGAVDNGIGDYYDIAQSIGVEDKNNVYGNSTQTSYNNGKGYHNLSTTTSHMLKNSEWGAVAYLASSRYGAGVNKVQKNSRYDSGGTGHGPNGGTYNTDDGQLASTTNNVYGVYDMSGGSYEYVMGNFTTDTSQSSTDYFSNAVKPPYVNLYPDSIFNSDNLTNNNKCTWATCGGHALHETKSVQLVSDYLQSWGDNYSNFINPSYTWFQRSGYAYDDIGAGLFNSDDNSGDTDDTYGFRVVLMTK